MNTHNIPFLNIKIILNYPQSATMGFVPRDPRTSFETAVVNEPSLFEPLKVYCIRLQSLQIFCFMYFLQDHRTFKLYEETNRANGGQGYLSLHMPISLFLCDPPNGQWRFLY